MSWDYSVVNGQIVATARVRGVLYWDALLGGGRALLIVQFKRLDGSILATEVVDTGNVPGRDANLPINQRLVDIQRSSSSLHSVTIITADFSTGRAAHTGSRTSVAPRQFDHNIIIDGGRADFGSLPHVLGAPSLPARLTFVRTNGAMSASVTGRIFWDSFSFGPGTAIMSVEFLNGAGARLRNPADQFRVNGTGINANFPVNSSPVAASLNSGSLTAVRFTVGELTSRGFQPSAPARAIRFND